MVVGVRTSGSYLAPLFASMLRSAGYEEVGVMTLRPKHPLRPSEQAALRALAARGGLLLLTDDPPVSGASLADAAADLERAGAPAANIVLLLQLFGSEGELPQPLRRFAAVVLAWDDWDIHAQMEPAAVSAGLAAFLGPDFRVASVERLGSLASPAVRGHLGAAYRVLGPAGEECIYARGTGLGYLGRSVLAVTEATAEYLPRIFGVHDGVLYREWLPEGDRVATTTPSTLNEDRLATAAAAYVLARQQRLHVPDDRSTRLFGEWPAWEAASIVLSRVGGRAALPMRLVLGDSVVKRLLSVERPCVVDGSMGAAQWFVGPKDELRKVGFEDGVFRNDVELTSYDPVFDLAGVAPGARSPSLPAAVRRAYEARSGVRISDERWLLLQLALLWKTARTQHRAADAARASARAVQRYFASTLLGDLPRDRPSGPVCALDVDGVLETSHLGFPSTTPAGALAIRALICHGYQVVLASGRSTDEVRERCEAYGLPGGVAEYGAVIYNHLVGRARALLTPTEYEDLAHLRGWLGRRPAVLLDPDYRHSVRAYRVDSRGRRHALQTDVVQAALRESGTFGRLRAIQGEDQTDFTVSRCDKASGLRELIHEVAATLHSAEHLALAVGDTAADIPMLQLAAIGRAPAHARPSLAGAGIATTRRPYQAGLALAVADLLGHAAGGCGVCRAPEMTAETRLLTSLLGLGEAGRRRTLARAPGLAARLRFHRGSP
jgi:hydroxymethylpyrimidine pyrophosphatase-like HAD family hydrolase